MNFVSYFTVQDMLVNGRRFDGPDLYTSTGTVNRELSHTCIGHLFFQMGGGISTPIRELTLRKSYIIVHVGRSMVGERSYIILKLWDEFPQGGGRHIFIILPDNYAKLFIPRLALKINIGTINVRFVLLWFTLAGRPLYSSPAVTSTSE